MSDLLRVMGLALAAICGISSFAFRFSNPHLTETQLFIALFPYIAPVVLVATCLIVAAEATKDEE